MPASSLLFESFAQVPDVWQELCPPHDLAMNPKVLDIFQRTLADQCKCWGVVIVDDSGAAIGCAALCAFSTELIETANPFIQRLLIGVRRSWLNFAKIKVLFCGLPVPSGATHLRVRSAGDTAQVVAEIHRVMGRLACTTGSTLMVFKELDGTNTMLANTISALGYSSGDIPPMHLLEGGFSDFSGYRNALKSRYRAQVQRSEKKLISAGFEVVSGCGADFFNIHFDARTHLLYLNVHARAKQKLECLPLSFFRQMAAELGEEVLLTLIKRDGRICAFTFAVTCGDTHYNLYSGIDYALNEEGDLYYNLFYSDLDAAFRAGVTEIHLGQTSDHFKSRLGTKTQPLWFFARARNSLLNAALRLFAKWLLPRVEPVIAHDVFARQNK